jgi:hypothetical protein
MRSVVRSVLSGAVPHRRRRCGKEARMCPTENYANRRVRSYSDRGKTRFVMLAY